MQKHTWMMFLVIPVISQNYFMQKASYMQVKLIADTIKYHFRSRFSRCDLVIPVVSSGPALEKTAGTAIL